MQKYITIILIFIFPIILYTIYEGIQNYQIKHHFYELENMPSCNIRSIYVDGGILNLDSMTNKAYIVNVFSTKCKFCLKEHKVLNDFKKNNSEIEIIGIVKDDLNTNVEGWLMQNGNPYSFIGNHEQTSCFNELKVKSVPTTFFVDANRKIFGIASGNLTVSRMNSISKEMQKIKPNTDLSTEIASTDNSMHSKQGEGITLESAILDD